MSRPRRRGNREEALRRSAAFLNPATERWHVLLEDHERKRETWHAIVQQNPGASAMADRAVHQNAEGSEVSRMNRRFANSQKPTAAFLVCCCPHFLPLELDANSHSVERAIHKEERDQEEYQREHPSQSAVLRGKLDRQLYGQQAEEGRELDHGIHGNRRSVFEWIANRVADHGGVMQWCSLLFEIDFDNLFRVVPCAAGVRHEDRLIEAERCNRNQ